MEIHLKIVGVLLIGVSLIHITFPKNFNWKKELSTLSLVNKQMMYIHTIFIAITLILIGLLCIFSSKELVETSLGSKIALGLFVFFVIRLYVQFFGYSSELWKGKRFETIVHILFSIFWTYVSVVFFIVYWMFS